MKKLTDVDGIDGPFERGMAAPVKPTRKRLTDEQKLAELAAEQRELTLRIALAKLVATHKSGDRREALATAYEAVGVAMVAFDGDKGRATDGD